MQKAGLDESQVGIKIAGRNINNLRYADHTTLMAKSEAELKSLLMQVNEESAKVGLKQNIKKTKIMASGPLTSWQIDGKKWRLTGSLSLQLRQKLIIDQIRSEVSLEVRHDGTTALVLQAHHEKARHTREDNGVREKKRKITYEMHPFRTTDSEGGTWNENPGISYCSLIKNAEGMNWK
ncbi:putative uncharacterized transposon-derived protein F52C9.6 [Varanus komodoensis]|nr:putative uncharacterized transposon-derived protein F52C9.6 [Varanus komodoensis]